MGKVVQHLYKKPHFTVKSMSFSPTAHPGSLFVTKLPLIYNKQNLSEQKDSPTHCIHFTAQGVCDK